MAEDTRQLDPFFNNLESSNFNEAFDTSSEQPEEIGGKRLRRASLQTTARRPRYGLLVLMAILASFLGYVGLKEPTTSEEVLNEEENFELPQVEMNPIIVNTPKNRILLDDDSAEESSFTLNTNSVGQGNYFIPVAECSFQACIQSYQNALENSQLPMHTQQTTQNYFFLRAISKKTLAAEQAATLLQKVDELNYDGLYPSTIKQNAGQRIVLGLFSTLVEANTAIQRVQAYLGENSMDFSIDKVPKKKILTKVYIGPFLDKQTAQNVKNKLPNLAKIEGGQVTRL